MHWTLRAPEVLFIAILSPLISLSPKRGHAKILDFGLAKVALVYPVREKGVDNLWLQPLDGGPGRQLTNFGSVKIYSYHWSPDGKSLALVQGDSPSDLVLIQNSPRK